MAFTVTSLGSFGNTANVSHYTCTLSRAPAANTLVLAAVLAGDLAGTPTEPIAVTGADLVFSLVTSSITFDPTTVGSELHNLSVWRSMKPTTVSTTTVTVEKPNQGTGCCILVVEIDGVDTSGTSGAGAVGKSANSVADAASALTVFGPTATAASSAWMAFMAVDASTALDVPGENFTSLDTALHATPQSGLFSAWTTLSTGVTVTWSGDGAQDRAGVLVELIAAPAAGGDVISPYYSHYYTRLVVGEAA